MGVGSHDGRAGAGPMEQVLMDCRHVPQRVGSMGPRQPAPVWQEGWQEAFTGWGVQGEGREGGGGGGDCKGRGRAYEGDGGKGKDVLIHGGFSYRG